MTDTASTRPRRVIVDVPTVDTHCHHFQGSRQCEETTADRVAIALAELDEWAMSVLEKQTPPQLLGNVLEDQPDRISNERRANYVAALRLHMAIEQISTAMAIDLAVKHPKGADIVKALKEWANRAHAVAEPSDTQRVYSTT